MNKKAYIEQVLVVLVKWLKTTSICEVAQRVEQQDSGPACWWFESTLHNYTPLV